jgi:hypothetical protein
MKNERVVACVLYNASSVWHLLACYPKPQPFLGEYYPQLSRISHGC